MEPVREIAPAVPVTRRLATILAWMLAVAFAIAALWLLGIAFNLKTANALLETERDLARVSDQLSRSQLEERTFVAEKIINELNSRQQQPDDLSHLRVANLQTDRALAPDARFVVVWDPVRRTGLLVGENLPEIPSGEILQLWIESTAGQTQSVSTFEPEGRGISAPFALTEAPADIAGFRLTRENSPAPTKPGDRVLGVARVTR